MARVLRWAGFGLAMAGIALWLAWLTSPNPQGNPASFEDVPVEGTIAPLSEAVSLASYRTSDGAVATLLVTSGEPDSVIGVDLVGLGTGRTGDPLQDLASLDWSNIDVDRIAQLPAVRLGMAELLPAGSAGAWHIGTGTNFPEHAAEANSDSVFQFPKFGEATPARTKVQSDPAVLLDYEVELCMRFDRAIASAEDFDAAIKGVFLCGDFTNRNALVMLADAENLDSGSGFSDAKSGPDFYPSGPIIVVPRDWSAFVDRVRMTTSVNGEPRQDARGAEMTMDFRELALKALGDMDRPRFLYGEERVRLAPNGRIDPEMTLMSGTSEGTIFTPPTRGDYVEALARYLMRGGPLSGSGLMDTGREVFIANELESGHFLQPGDVVRYDSNLLGNIKIEVVE